MCGPSEKILGRMYVIHSNMKEHEEWKQKMITELVDLVRAKCGTDARAVEIRSNVHMAQLIQGVPNFGSVPGWCVRSIDRANPTQLAMHFEVAVRSDTELESWATVTEEPT